jgi:hypothetical protein
MNLRNEARGRDCQIRLPSICNWNRETTVGCHFRLPGLSGMGIKPDDLFIAFGCSACHQWCDTHKDNETQLAFAQGVFRSQAILRKEGKL